MKSLLKDMKFGEKSKTPRDGKPPKVKNKKVEKVDGESWLFAKVNALN